MNTNKILPIFFICYREGELHDYTFNSYISYVYDEFPTPIIFFNSSKDEQKNVSVRAKLKALFGKRTYILHENIIDHDYNSVQVASMDCLLYAHKQIKKQSSWVNYLLLRKPKVFDGVMFCEDDITFSNLFVRKVSQFNFSSRTAFLTAYQPEHGYICNPHGEFSPEVFYGTQCTIFPLDSLKKLCYNAKRVKEMKEGYDRAWVKFLSHFGYQPYALDGSYVQHNQVASLLAGHTRTHTSAVFKFNWEEI